MSDQLITEDWLAAIGCINLGFDGPSCGRSYSLGGVAIDGYQTFDYSIPPGTLDSGVIVCWIPAWDNEEQLKTRRQFADAMKQYGYSIES